jgi:hypothetical protein
MGNLTKENSYLLQDKRGFIQLCIDKIFEKVSTLGYNVSVEQSFHDLKEHLADQSAVINPSFDPDEHDLEDAFWLRVSDEDGTTVACHAERIYSTSDFVTDYLISGKLWWQRSAANPAENWREEIKAPPVKLSGTVAYAGSMLISKPHRGRGLSLLLPYLSRALCIRNYGTDFHTGIVRESLAGSAVPTGNYGFPRTTPIFKGTLPGLQGPMEQVHLCWMNQQEGIERFSLLPTHPKFPVGLGAFREMVLPAISNSASHPMAA